MSIYRIAFSPTGGTARVSEVIACRIAAGQPVHNIDLCAPHGADEVQDLTEDDVCVVAVPSFGGRVAAPAAERLDSLRGNGARAIAVCVYGNRAYEDTLVELQDLLEGAGFTCIAGVAAVAEHSIVRSVATGRPNTDDIAELEHFADKILARLEAGLDSAQKPTLPGTRPYKPYGVVPMAPAADETCVRCGACARSCPVGAIPLDAPDTVDADHCASCMRCIAVCPVGARHLDTERLTALTAKLESIASEPKSNELFL